MPPARDRRTSEGCLGVVLRAARGTAIISLTQRSRHCGGKPIANTSNSPGSGGSYSQAYGFATITMYSWWRSSEIEWRTKIAARLGGGVEAGREQSCRLSVENSLVNMEQYASPCA